MRIKTIITIAMAVTLIGVLGGSRAVLADTSTDAQSELQAPEPVPAPDTPQQPVPPTVKCPQCGADCPMPYARRGRGMRAPKGHSGRGASFMHQGRGQRHGGMRAGMPAEGILRSASKLELTDDQIAQLEKLSYDAKSKLIDLESDLDKAQLEMKRQMETDGDDISAMKKQLESAAKIKVNIQTLKLENWIAAKNVLTEDQKKLVREHHPRLGTKL